MKIGVIDIETTGFLREGGHIVEFGLVELDTDTGDVTPVLDFVCNEPGMTKKERDAWIFKNSTLTIESVRSAEPFEYMKDTVQHWVEQFHFVTAFNKSFDFDFLKNRGIQFFAEWPCPMVVATDVCKIPKTGAGARYGGYKWPNVEEAWKHFFPEIAFVEQHRGLDDAKHEAMIVYELFKMGVMK